MDNLCPRVSRAVRAEREVRGEKNSASHGHQALLLTNLLKNSERARQSDMGRQGGGVGPQAGAEELSAPFFGQFPAFEDRSEQWRPRGGGFSTVGGRTVAVAVTLVADERPVSVTHPVALLS